MLHNSLPELSLSEVDTSIGFLGKRISFPLLIEGMVGGFFCAASLNRNLAIAAEETRVALGLGSQRAMLEDSRLRWTYDVRAAAPSVPLLGNIGAAQLLENPVDRILVLAEDIDADGLVVHLNPAQEAFQSNGDTDWRGVEDKIAELCQRASVPILVKETGCGLSGSVARRLEAAGVAWLDVAGAGGTSWVKVEQCNRPDASGAFDEWGIPTAESLVQCKSSTQLPLIASGGIRSGIECAKALALGASMVGVALPLLGAALHSASEVVTQIGRLDGELKRAMFLCGARTVLELSWADIQHRPSQ